MIDYLKNHKIHESAFIIKHRGQLMNIDQLMRDNRYIMTFPICYKCCLFN